MNAQNAMIAWSPYGNRIKVMPWPDTTHESDSYVYTCLCEPFEGIPFQARKAIIFIEAMHIIVRDKVDPLAVHRELLKLEEYCDGCSDDMPGMSQQNQE